MRKAESPMRFINIALVSSLLAVGHAEAAEPVMTVVSARAMAKQTATLVHGIGTVAPWREVQVSADIQGVVISEMVVEPGDSVAVGDTLAVLDNRALATALERAVAAERSAEADLAQARAALTRGRSLSSSKAVSEESIESLETAAARAEAAKAQAKANLSDASRDAEKALVRSPVAGTVLSVALNAGATSTNGALVVIASEGKLEVSADVPDIDFPTVVVTVSQQGASPTELETQVTEIVEEALATVADVESVESTSRRAVPYPPASSTWTRTSTRPCPTSKPR